MLKLRYPATGSPSLSIAGLTSRSCAEVIAAIWQDSTGSILTAHYLYSYWWGEWGGYGRTERVSQSDALIADEIKRKLEAHPTIAEVVPEYAEVNPFVPTV
jgi:hypothetical protein